MQDPTVSEVLKSKEALLVQFAVKKRLGIQETRERLQTVAPGTRLRNAIKSEPLRLTEVRKSAYREYKLWLDRLCWHFSFDSISSLFDEVSGRHKQAKLKNMRRAGSSPHAYEFGLEPSKDRDPWAEITAGCVSEVARLVSSINEEALKCARDIPFRRSIDDQELERYVQLRLRNGGAIGQIAKPVARIVCLAMSTNPKSTLLRCETWSDDQSQQSWRYDDGAGGGSNTWYAIIEAVKGEVCYWETRGVPVLIVLDCALGWPRRMAEAIEAHEAGNALWEQDRSWRPQRLSEEDRKVQLYHDSQTPTEGAWRRERNQFFRRQTEIHVRDGLQSSKPYGPFGLDVGADKSARTGHQALRLIDELRRNLVRDLPVLTTWCGPITQSSVIEVTTVEARRRATREHAERVRARPPRRTDEARRSPVGPDGTAEDSITESERESRWRMNLMLASASAFLGGRLETPREARVDDVIARKEGWIWWQPIDVHSTLTDTA